MEGESTRQLKVSKQIQRDLAEIIRSKGMSVFAGAMITLSGVKISPDLGLAKVYISVFPSSKAQEALAIINQMKKSIRGELGKLVSKQLRIVPELNFYLDDSLDYVEKIEELLKS